MDSRFFVRQTPERLCTANGPEHRIQETGGGYTRSDSVTLIEHRAACAITTCGFNVVLRIAACSREHGLCRQVNLSQMKKEKYVFFL